MPLSGFDSYPVTAREIAYLWERINEELAAAGQSLVLPGGYALADLRQDSQLAEEALRQVRQAEKQHAMDAIGRDMQKRALSPLLLRFRLTVRGTALPDHLLKGLPTVPPFSTAEGAFMAALEAAVNRWALIDAAVGLPEFTPPLMLGSCGLAEFRASVERLRAAYQASRAAWGAVGVARRQREERCAELKRRLFQFRDVAVGCLGPDHVLIQSMPRLTPRRGSTPKPVELTASWDAEVDKACLSWTASDNPHLARYSVRACGGTKYLSRHEFVVASAPREQTMLLTDAGLAGTVPMWFRVYVVTDEGHERGSEAVQVARPSR